VHNSATEKRQGFVPVQLLEKSMFLTVHNSTTKQTRIRSSAAPLKKINVLNSAQWCNRKKTRIRASAAS
jgi:hypothetical protein